MIKKFSAAGAALAAGALLCASALLAQTKGTPPENPREMPPYGNPNQHQDATPMTSMPSGQISLSDASFLRKAAAGGAAEVESRQPGQDKASNPEVKQFAQKMVDDHSAANSELKTLAQQKGVAVPTQPDFRSKKELDRLSKLSGPAFDRAYMKLMVSDHEKDVSEFQKESRSAQDSDVKSFAGKTLPTLQDHLRLAREDNSKVAGS